jgi:hypothetical protein
MNVESRDGPRNAELGPLLGKLEACYKASPRRTANEAVRVSLRMAVNATGGVTTTATATLGTLADKGRGQQGYVFGGELSKTDDALSKCIEEAGKSATVTVPGASRGTRFGVTVDLSP